MPAVAIHAVRCVADQVAVPELVKNLPKCLVDFVIGLNLEQFSATGLREISKKRRSPDAFRRHPVDDAVRSFCEVDDGFCGQKTRHFEASLKTTTNARPGCDSPVSSAAYAASTSAVSPSGRALSSAARNPFMLRVSPERTRTSSPKVTSAAALRSREAEDR
jgi:hypothetical protein